MYNFSLFLFAAFFKWSTTDATEQLAYGDYAKKANF